jgi:hypothetical protein
VWSFGPNFMDKHLEPQYSNCLSSWGIQGNFVQEWDHDFNILLEPPLFYYITFIKHLSIDEMDERIEGLFRNHRIITSQNFNHSKRVVTQEIFKTLMNKISLRELRFHSATTSMRYILRIPYTSYPGAIDCLRDLLELKCDSNVHFEFFCQLSRTCHRLQRFASC